MKILKNIINKLSFILAFYKERKRMFELFPERIHLSEITNTNNFIFTKAYPPGHFYSPIPDFTEIKNQKAELFQTPRDMIPGIPLNTEDQLELLNQFTTFSAELPFSHESRPKLRYYFDNNFFSYGDGVILYSFLRYLKPKKIIEIGSGFSSAEMIDINNIFFDNSIKFTFIEPYPEERLYTIISDEDQNTHKIITEPVQKVPLNLFQEFSANDILFVDSSHVAKIGSDVMHIVMNVLPLLPKGVVIHFHDIFWPFEYPEKWFEVGRAWNEAYLLRAFLQYNDSFKILFFNSFMEKHHTETIRKKLPMMLSNPSNYLTFSNSSIWIQKIN